MLGVDYSRRSVEFARRIARSRGERPLPRRDSSSSSNNTNSAPAEEEKEEVDEVEFLEHDILKTPPSALLSGAQSQGWDVVLDKGTFDAISLSSETDPASGRRASESYKARILPLVREGGLFLVTSCNWTEEELRGWFVGVKEKEEEEEDERTRRWRFEEVGKVEYPSFSFGGAKGQTISSLCFRKARNNAS